MNPRESPMGRSLKKLLPNCSAVGFAAERVLVVVAGRILARVRFAEYPPAPANPLYRRNFSGGLGYGPSQTSGEKAW